MLNWEFITQRNTEIKYTQSPMVYVVLAFVENMPVKDQEVLVHKLPEV